MDPIDLFARSPVVGAVVLCALLFFGFAGVSRLWRRKRRAEPPAEGGTRFTSAPDLAIVLIGLMLLVLVVGQVMRFLD